MAPSARQNVTARVVSGIFLLVSAFVCSCGRNAITAREGKGC